MKFFSERGGGEDSTGDVLAAAFSEKKQGGLAG
jgi:hypothetical protein